MNRRPLVSLSSPKWWSGFGPIEVPFTAGESNWFPSNAEMIMQNAVRAGQMRQQRAPSDKSGWDVIGVPWSWENDDRPPEDDPSDRNKNGVPDEDEPVDDTSGSSSGAPDWGVGWGQAPPIGIDIPQGVDFEIGVGAPPSDTSPDWGDILGGVRVPGGGSSNFSANSLPGIGPYAGALEALHAEDPYYKFAGAAALVPGIGGPLSLGLNAFGKLAGIGRVKSSDRRQYGKSIWDATLPVFWQDVIGRPAEELYGTFGASDADRRFIEGFTSTRLDPMSSGVGKYPLNYNSVYADYGDPSGLAQGLVEYYNSLPASERPALGDIEGWSDLGTTRESLAEEYAKQMGWYDNIMRDRAVRNRMADMYGSAYDDDPAYTYSFTDILNTQYNPYGDW